MHLTDAINVLYISDPERFHYFIVNIFDVVLVGAPVIPPHALPQLKPNIFLKVTAPIWPQINIV